MIAASISLDFRYIATLRTSRLRYLSLYDLSTEQRLSLTGGRIVKGEGPLWFTPSGLNICCTLRGKGAEVVEITQDGHLGNITVTPAADIEGGLWGCPWGTSGGYQITSDGWVLGVGGKRLLMLPPPWHSYAEKRVWNGQFLALLHGTLPEPVILELDP